MKITKRVSIEQLLRELIAEQSRDNDVITYGSFFSGMECPLVGLEGACSGEHGRTVVSEFGIEISPHCTGVLKLNFDHKKLYDDVTKVKIKDDLCHVNLFWSSAPCQDFSKHGKRLGTTNPRGKLYKYPCRYINHHLPDAFVMEQVAAFKEDPKHKTAFTAQMRTLKRNKCYEIQDVVLNTGDFGIPQCRWRLYIIGIKKAKLLHKPVFDPPRGVACVRLEDLLDNYDGTEADLPTQMVAVSNLLSGLHKAQVKYGKNPLDRLFMMDLFGSKVNVASEQSPCITAARAAAGGYWLSTKRRFTNINELLRLQGVPPARFLFGKTSKRQIGHMIGNGVSANVACHLWTEIIHATSI